MTLTEKIILIGIVSLPFLLMIISIFRNKNSSKPQSADEEEILNREPQILTMHAKVVDVSCFITHIGTKLPKVVKNFVVVFEDDNEQIHKIPVEEDIYDSFEIGQIGELTLIDGKINSYVLDE